jgi:hypothetical protein
MNAHVWELLIAAGIVLYAGWRVSLRLHPYAACRRCQNRRGRNWGSTSAAWGNCGACGGSGRRKRLGAR